MGGILLFLPRRLFSVTHLPISRTQKCRSRSKNFEFPVRIPFRIAPSAIRPF